METTVGVLCARVRVEEKQLLAALAEAGLVATPLVPAAAPLPIPPRPSLPLQPGAVPVDGPGALIDRGRDRAATAALLRVHRALGTPLVDAGLAATGDRLAVAAALAAAGLPRPVVQLAASAVAAMAAIDAAGYPATILPLDPGASPVVILDLDTAEAVVEHRAILGSCRDLPALVQAGVPDPDRATVHVVGGRAVALSGAVPAAASASALRLAERAADAIGATFCGIELSVAAGNWVVWDVEPVPDFRDATPLVAEGVAGAIAQFVARLVATPAATLPPPPRTVRPLVPAAAHAASVDAVVPSERGWAANGRREVRGDAVLLA